jgi:hypothetical protein
VDEPALSTETTVLPGRKRPIAVTLVGFLALAVGLYFLVEGAFRVSHESGANRIGAGAFDIVLGVFALAIGRGALRSARWAWAALMTWAVIGLTNELLRHFFYGDESYVSLALDAAIVLALTPLDIQVAFGVRTRPSPSVGFEVSVEDGS